MDVSVNGAMFEENLNIKSFVDIYTTILKWVERNNSNTVKPFEITLVLPGFCLQPLLPYRKRFLEESKIKLFVKYDPFIGCMAFKESVVITSEGKFTGCTAMYNMENFMAGDIKKRSVKNILDNWGNMQNLIKEREKRIKTVEPCNGCEYWKICRGGCPAVAYKYYKTIMKSDPTCIKMQKQKK